MKVSAFHLIDNLSSSLYENPGQCWAELARNSLVCSMPKNRWEPKGVKIETMLVDQHPLSPDRKAKTLIVLDHGEGLTDPALDRYFTWLGTPLAVLKTQNTNNGASQKGIGRLAALALNSRCINGDIEERIKHGYYLLSRTGKEGNVRYVEVVPEKAELAGGFDTNRFISPSATEMGPLKNIQGSFTAIVIPTPVFSSHDEIYEAIKWFLPREQDKMYHLEIGGKRVYPPALKAQVSHTWGDHAEFRAYLSATTEKDGLASGCWLCDSETSLRVASCERLMSSIPEPLWYPELQGDIFAPGLLRYQNTARSTLAKDFMKGGSKDWNRLHMFLIEVASKARSLIDRDSINGPAAETLDELVEMFQSRFGEPDKIGVVGPPGPPRGPKGPIIDPPGPGPKPPGGEKKYQRHVSIKIRDKTYHLCRNQSLHPYIFAQVSSQNSQMVYVNIRGGYKSLPVNKQARKEHCLMQILTAIGQNMHRTNPYSATRFTNEVRGELFK